MACRSTNIRADREKRRVAIITGANHGIGAATAAQGVKVILTSYRPDTPYSEDELEEAKRAAVDCISCIRTGPLVNRSVNVCQRRLLDVHE